MNIFSLISTPTHNPTHNPTLAMEFNRCQCYACSPNEVDAKSTIVKNFDVQTRSDCHFGAYPGLTFFKNVKEAYIASKADPNIFKISFSDHRYVMKTKRQWNEQKEKFFGLRNFRKFRSAKDDDILYCDVPLIVDEPHPFWGGWSKVSRRVKNDEKLTKRQKTEIWGNFEVVNENLKYKELVLNVLSQAEFEYLFCGGPKPKNFVQRITRNYQQTVKTVLSETFIEPVKADAEVKIEAKPKTRKRRSRRSRRRLSHRST